VVASLQSRFLAHARAVQSGESEYIASDQWLGVVWPADELALIDLVTSHQIELFYEEARHLLRALVASRVPAANLRLVDEAVALNAALLRVPFEVDDLELHLTHDLWETYRDLVTGVPRRPVERVSNYRIVRTDPVWMDREDWCEDVLARLNSKSSFLYPISRLEDRLTDAVQATL